MLIRSTILFILFYIQLLLAAPIRHSPNTGLEHRGEVEGLPTPTLAPTGSPFNLHSKRHGNHDGNEVNLERRGDRASISPRSNPPPTPPLHPMGSHWSVDTVNPGRISRVWNSVKDAAKSVKNAVKKVAGKFKSSGQT